jgi:hypothetical protein
MKKDFPYCMDSSALIAAWDERYPPDNFPKFWDLMDSALQGGRMYVPENVIDELMKKSKDLAAWLKQRPASIVAYEADIQIQGKKLLVAYKRLVMEKKHSFAADPFVIATAQIKGYIVVTEEGFTGSMNRPNIPDVCRAENQDCIRLIDMIRTEAWVIG